MIFEYLQVNPSTGQATYIHEEKGIWTPVPTTGTQSLPVHTTIGQTHSTYRSVNRSSAGTTSIVTCPVGGSVQVFDLLLSTDKVNTATVTIQFDDGSNQEVLFAINVTDAPANLAIPFSGRWQGWRNADLNLVTTSTVNATIAVSYIKRPESQVYAEWDAQR